MLHVMLIIVVDGVGDGAAVRSSSSLLRLAHSTGLRVGDKRRRHVTWLPVGDHPLKLERCRED